MWFLSIWRDSEQFFSGKTPALDDPRHLSSLFLLQSSWAQLEKSHRSDQLVPSAPRVHGLSSPSPLPSNLNLFAHQLDLSAHFSDPSDSLLKLITDTPGLKDDLCSYFTKKSRYIDLPILAIKCYRLNWIYTSPQHSPIVKKLVPSPASGISSYEWSFPGILSLSCWTKSLPWAHKLSLKKKKNPKLFLFLLPFSLPQLPAFSWTCQKKKKIAYTFTADLNPSLQF